MDQEHTKDWLKENWFKAGILISILIIAYSFYHVLVVKPEREAKREEAAKIEAQLVEEQRKTKAKEDLASCVTTAESNYSSIWFGECKARGLLSQWCIETENLDFQEYLTKLGIPEEEYKKQRGITDDKAFSAILDYFERKEDCSCSLPLAIADRKNESLKDAKDICYKQYPQN
ncbi:hypothetical protein A3J02_01975 [Candidatus Azambacteria bacterium RIFCSPLOWO2_02_FULL_46_11]|uniref:Uncharacterized protein n=3 Tax=Candidatus Azamiibacteriota TaxID=1752741 RepID=A0A1F5C7G5_9BACT|nr:MAG: hypothetical protein A2W60_01625 [Candidatus Azambacteria bacterium RIFCSPHIGHO2_02_46_12]OGD38785.1 MAG: hypothetical protein A3A25_03495 [Candidatus Azambacteria bacterium RIFCSPLOWO2_01_FULL_46_26]OGD44162.1 MAG: hypothetical protein A3J02_01975 [Candidatus Azambacteria bacterium RIFCSPLOWO2_02_FULL_46_11]